MKCLHIAVILLSSLFLFSMCDKSDEPGSDRDTGKFMGQISDPVKKFLGDEILSILQSPDRVESYKVKFHKNRAEKNLGGYPIIDKGKVLVPKQIEILQSVFMDEKTYLFDVVKKCLFLPEYGFRVVKDKKEVVVLLCFSCEEVTFVYKDKELLEDFDNATKRLRALTDSLFD